MNSNLVKYKGLANEGVDDKYGQYEKGRLEMVKLYSPNGETINLMATPTWKEENEWRRP